MRAKITTLLPHLYLIDDAGESTCYLLCGRDRALLIDTVNGREDLSAVVRSLTALPVTVVNTHGHCDHIYGNVFFPEAWMHPADNALAAAHFGFIAEDMARAGRQPCTFRPLEIGQVIDLGGVTLEVISLRGHTEGSVGLIAREDRILFSGDGLNTHLWMQLEESTSIAELQETLLAVQRCHAHKFDRVLTGHASGFEDKAILDALLAGCDDLLHGRREQDQPYRYFGGECLQHPLSPRPGHCIVYAHTKI